MKMNRKNSTILIVSMFLIVAIFPGCLKEPKIGETKENILTNLPPVPQISAPNVGYFGEIITFDASKSYDSDGVIKSYTWIFEDNKKIEGKKAVHQYTIDKDRNVKYPVVYSVVLSVEDDKGAIEYSTYEIKIYPKRYIFYLKNGGMENKKPKENYDKIKTSFGMFKFIQPYEISYQLSKPIEIYPCVWNAVVFIEKPTFIPIIRMEAILYNETGGKIAEAVEKFKMFDFWRERKITFNGNIDILEEFASVKLVVYGFSLKEKIKIWYGGERASRLSFDFSTLK